MSESLEAEEPSDESEPLLLLNAKFYSICAFSFSIFLCISTFGHSSKNSRCASVRSPSSMLVKKLIENRTLESESRGKSPSRQGVTSSSSTYFFNCFNPNSPAIYCHTILMKIRPAAVVSSSVNFTNFHTFQWMASV